jgi:hypothetical protein
MRAVRTMRTRRTSCCTVGTSLPGTLENRDDSVHYICTPRVARWLDRCHRRRGHVRLECRPVPTVLCRSLNAGEPVDVGRGMVQQHLHLRRQRRSPVSTSKLQDWRLRHRANQVDRAQQQIPGPCGHRLLRHPWSNDARASASDRCRHRQHGGGHADGRRCCCCYNPGRRARLGGKDALVRW